MLSISDEALTIIGEQGGERKRGDFVSMTVLEWAKRQNEPALPGGILERIEQRLAKIEQMIAG
mgnify:FL=1